MNLILSPRGNRDLMRAMNRSIILNVIKASGPIARAEIARRTHLSPATITNVAAELIRDDLIFEKESGHSTGGRRPILLSINPSGRFVVGIKLTETQAIGVLLDLEATIVTNQTDELEDSAPETVVRQLAVLVSELLGKAGLAKTKLLGVGVGLAGIVNADQGLLRQTPFFDWRDLPLRDLLQEQVGVPVSIDNDVNALTLAERWFGAGQGLDSFLSITVGRGIGMGIVVNGQFYRGARGGAGEFGHIVIDPDGPTCDCGKRGCLEAFVGDPGLLRVAAEATRRGDLPGSVHCVDDLLALADQGNPSARQILAHAGALLGQSIANLVNIFNPQRVIIGGEGARMGNWFFDPMRDAVQAHALSALYQDVEIQIEPWGDDAWARGAGSLVLRDLFESPVHQEAVVIGAEGARS